MLWPEGIFAWDQLQPPLTGEEECLFHLEKVKKVCFPIWYIFHLGNLGFLMLVRR